MMRPPNPRVAERFEQHGGQRNLITKRVGNGEEERFQRAGAREGIQCRSARRDKQRINYSAASDAEQSHRQDQTKGKRRPAENWT
jgi:hypothetical protein